MSGGMLGCPDCQNTNSAFGCGKHHSVVTLPFREAQMISPSLVALIALWRSCADILASVVKMTDTEPHKILGMTALIPHLRRLADELEAALVGLSTGTEQMVRNVAALLDALPADYDWNTDPHYLTLLEGAMYRLKSTHQPPARSVSPDLRAWHKVGCQKPVSNIHTCTCGLDAALNAR